MTTKQTSKLRSALIILGVTLLCLSAVEGAGRLVIRYTELKRPTGIFGEAILSWQEPLLGFGLKKNISQSLGSWNVRTNRLGMREESELAVPKPKGEIRIFMVGGSTTFGWGVDARDSIPVILQRLVDSQSRSVASADPRPTVRIINAGVPYYASWHEAAMVFFRVLELEPDWILIMDGLNDVAQSLPPNWSPVHLGYLDTPSRIAYQKLRQDPKDRSFLIDLLDTSTTFQYFRTKLAERKQLAAGVYHPEVWDQYIHLMDRVARLSTSNGIRFSTFLQPVICVDKPLAMSEIATNETSISSPEFAATFRHAYLEGEKRLQATKLFRSTSLREAFKDIKDPIYIDGQHYNALGNEILAKLIFEKEIAPHLPEVISARK